MEMSVGHGFQIFSVLVPSFSLYPLIITPFFYFFNFCGFFLDKMLRIWKWYQSCLSLHPVKTQIISSGFLWGIGDVAAQYITHSTAKKRLQYHKDDDNEFKVNWKRVAVTSMFGFGFVGPVGHFWYEELDKFIKMRLLLRPKSASRKKHCSSEGRREERLPPSLDIGRWRLANRSVPFCHGLNNKRMLPGNKGLLLLPP
ncbi:uncharacterized protein [Gossypium hirsutum]|uniref:Uncharacterized protein isoform X5 n=3 Tax=Gossypium TaxID=3633 RepID=A0ABM3BVP0_GOSHI|nr:uncharacterized protein LOC121203481 isoform X5 [Gossypium hirsutum]TYI21983.1 hypothetical protein ES332_A06G075700v1 [Gossypium tomentosum]